MRRWPFVSLVLIPAFLFALSCGGGGGGGSSSPDPITLVSVSTAGVAGSDSSEFAAVSDNGRYVAFVSYAGNLIANDTNTESDVFLRDMQTGMTSRVSVSTAGSEGVGGAGGNGSYYPAISGNGRYVAFEGEPINFVPDDTNGVYDIFLRDTVNVLTSRVSVNTAGSEGNWDSYEPAISSDGRYVAFYSESDNLVSGGSIDTEDIFLRDTVGVTTSQVSVSTAGTPGDAGSRNPDITPDGRYVVFESAATNLVPGVSDGNIDIYLHDTQGPLTTKVSVSPAGTEGNADSYNPAVSSDGSYVVFHSGATNLVSGDVNSLSDVFVHDTGTGITALVSVSTAGSQGDTDSVDAVISDNGRYVVFKSRSSTLVPEGSNNSFQIFVRDLQEGTTSKVSVSEAGVEGDGNSHNPSVSADGRYVVFESYGENLVTDPVPSGISQIYRAPLN